MLGMSVQCSRLNLIRFGEWLRRVVRDSGGAKVIDRSKCVREVIDSSFSGLGVGRSWNTLEDIRGQ